jgi:hypothetical protein
MHRSLALFCGLTLACGAAAGAASPRSPAASPTPPRAAAAPSHPVALTVVPGRGALELDAREPKGILLRSAFGASGAPAPLLRVEWGATLPAVKQAISSLSGVPAGDPLSCFQRDGDTFCFPVGNTLDWADLGAAWKSQARPGLRFAADGRFCHYALSFPQSDFDAVRAALEAQLGPPASDTPSKEQDPAGAAFDQRLILWKLHHVSVALQQRNPRVPGESEVHVVYTPIAGDTP